MKTCVPNTNPSLQLLCAFEEDDGSVSYETQPVIAFVVEDGFVAEVVGIEIPTSNEKQAIVDQRSGAWWVLGDASGDSLESAKEFLASLFAQPAGPAPAPLAVAA